MFPDDDKSKTSKDPLAVVVQWFKSRSPREKMLMFGGAGILLLFVLWIAIEDHDVLFILAEAAHFVGIALLVYKLVNKKTCVGISLRSQELTFLFLGVRLYCSFMMEYDIHTVLDALTLAATVWVIYTMMFQLKHTYQVELDTVLTAYVAGPCVLLAILVHPRTTHIWIHKVVERFTGHYVFCLGLSRFFSCAHWVLQIMDGNSLLMNIGGYGLWPVLVLLSEIVQTFILADFCYYYVKSYAVGSGVVRLPENVV